MTAVAPPPLSFQQHNNRISWTSGSHGHINGAMESEDASKMFAQGPRKTLQRQNSSSSIASTASSTSTISASSTQTSNTSVSSSNGDSNSWSAKKKPARGFWPPGKAEPATGLSTARPQPVNSNGSAPTATSTMSSLHAPAAPPQGTNAAQANAQRSQQNEQAPAAILHLTPMNGTFERKQISVPYYPEVLRIGRQTNQKTIPTPGNGYFDSKVLSRQHAEVWADRQGRVFIRDVKSSNGTFVNGMRLSQENKESEPRELREQDVLELGIDIVSEDQKTVVHHKVAAKVEHAGIYGQGNDVLSFGDLDPSAGGGLMAAQQMKRNASQTSVNGRVPAMGPGQTAMAAGLAQQPSQMRNWLNPITTEHIVKKLNAEMKLAKQQSEDLARARQCLDALLTGRPKPIDTNDVRSSEQTKASPTKAKLDLKAHFMDPPAPPPQAPLPDKPDVTKALADPAIQPLLRRNDTARPSAENSPVRYTDHSSDILRLCEELKLAKGEISTQGEKMKDLESQLAQERMARESAEERASRLENADKPDAPKTRSFFSSLSSGTSSLDWQAQIARLQATMDEMKQQMEQYRRRAESAEADRDEARQSLAELVESKRAEAAAASTLSPRTASKSRRDVKKNKDATDALPYETNGHAIAPTSSSPPASPTAVTLLEKAGLQEGQPITPEQAKLLTQLLSQEVLGTTTLGRIGGESTILYHGRPLSAAAIVVIFGVALMGWMNSWPRVER